ncbi:phage major capsid protein [Novispirillum sp. DQ9]|uniref:phage major capsid protein n=1 Tax=Novispirillum sp. DQ9 TaxID=3398612 RepID=UPI003C7E79F0
MDLKDLKKRRADKVAAMEKLCAGEMTDEQRAEFDKLEAEVGNLDKDIQRAERMQDLTRRSAAEQAPKDDGQGEQQRSASGGQDGPQAAADPFAGRTVAAAPAQQRDLGWEFGAFVRSYAQSQAGMRSGTDYRSASEVAKELYGERHHVTEALTRAQTVSSNAAGGFTVPQVYAPEIIRLFGPNTIVRQRAQVVPGNASYLRGKTGASVGYVGENEQGSETGVTFGMIDMKEKDIAAILPISKKLLRNTAFGVEAYCRDELVRAAAEFEDRMFLYGTGVGKQVKGYSYATPAAHKIAAINKAAPTNQEVRADLRKVLKAIVLKNVPIDQNNPAWFMNQAVKMYLEDLYQGDLKAFPTLEGPNPTLMGYPVVTTTQITGPAGDGGDIFFGAHRFAMIGDSVAMTLSTSDQASYKDAGGNQVNLWAQDMLGIKLFMSHDFALRHEDAFAMLTGVKWGQ